MRYLVYAAANPSPPKRDLAEGYSFRLWRPSLGQLVPPTLGCKFAMWTLAHYTRVFRNRDFSVLTIVNPEGKTVHRSCLVPAYLRWPFMGADDLQISSTWTDPGERGKGLATCALSWATTTMSSPGRTLWYVTRDENLASIAVCEKAGFRLVGHAKRVSRAGLRLFGQLVLEE